MGGVTSQFNPYPHLMHSRLISCSPNHLFTSTNSTVFGRFGVVKTFLRAFMNIFVRRIMGKSTSRHLF